MTRIQKILIITSCVLYVLTVCAAFTLSLPYILVFFVLFTLAVTAFGYTCYKAHNDYTGAEHLQQEIGVLKAEVEKTKAECDVTISEKDSAIRKLELEIGDLKQKLEDSELALAQALEQTVAAEESISRQAELMENLLPPDDEDPAVTVDIIDIANRAIDELSEQARSAQVMINVSSASEKLMVHAGARRLLIMFRNIIDNSIKYMQKAGTLVITISALEDDIFIVLKDTGKGLPENETKHIFELNFQGSNRISGNGLGLTQAKAIVEHYGGTIYARSPEGSGMGIYIQLPTS